MIDAIAQAAADTDNTVVIALVGLVVTMGGGMLTIITKLLGSHRRALDDNTKSNNEIAIEMRAANDLGRRTLTQVEALRADHNLHVRDMTIHRNEGVR